MAIVKIARGGEMGQITRRGKTGQIAMGQRGETFWQDGIAPFATYRYKSAPEWAIYRLKPISKTESKDSVCDMGGGAKISATVSLREQKSFTNLWLSFSLKFNALLGLNLP